MSEPHVVIIGGGFAGLHAARALSGAPARVTLVDRRNHHLFQPLLYQVATASLSPGEIAQPIRHILWHCPNVKVILGEVRRIVKEERRLELADGELSYDYLVLASGNKPFYFRHDDWASNAPGLKSVEDALEIRRRILLAFESAEREADEQRKKEFLTFIIVGGGPTGVELAGALIEIARHSLSREFRLIRPEEARIIVVEAAPRILAIFHESLSGYAERSLKRLGVEVYTGSPVTRIGDGFVEAGGRLWKAKTIIWAAGVSASPLGACLGAELDSGGRVIVDKNLNLPGHSEIFVAGDLASFSDSGAPLPAMAPVAVQMGRHAAENILRSARGERFLPFHFKDRGFMAVIGRHRAVAQIGKLRMTGWIAWVVWAVAHIFFLIGFRNRLIVLFEWAWSYFTFSRGVRLITWGPRSETPPH